MASRDAFLLFSSTADRNGASSETKTGLATLDKSFCLYVSTLESSQCLSTTSIEDQTGAHEKEDQRRVVTADDLVEAFDHFSTTGRPTSQTSDYRHRSTATEMTRNYRHTTNTGYATVIMRVIGKVCSSTKQLKDWEKI